MYLLQRTKRYILRLWTKL